jgi:nudix-type nucleoside diphosphatase (YffH/AdpP family)
MTRVFLYGTLCDPDLRRIVTGREDPVEPASQAGHVVRRVGRGDGATLVPDPRSKASGLVTGRLDGEVLARADWYARALGCRPRPVEAGGMTARAYVPDDAAGGGAAWDLAAWQRDWGPIFRRAAAEAMEHFPRNGPDWVAARWMQIRQRAASAARAAREARPVNVRSGLSSEDVEIVAARRPYTDYFSLVEQDLRFRQHDGGMSESVTRAALVAGDAVTVLPYDPAADVVLLIEQFRFGPWARGDRRPWTLEPIAGRIDPGEDAETAGRREALEEAGVEVGRLERVAAYYPTTGAMSEYIFSYVGLCRIDDHAGTVSGAAEEHEDILSHVVPFARLMDLVQSGEAENGPLILSALWLQSNRDRLRRG